MWMSSEEYRSKAAACLSVAESFKMPEARTRWLAMAQAWNWLADEADRMAIQEKLRGDREPYPEEDRPC
jgi:hypothetical protein